MRKGLLIAGAVVAAAAVYLLAWPVPVEPVAWSAPDSAGYGGAHAPRRMPVHRIGMPGIFLFHKRFVS